MQVTNKKNVNCRKMEMKHKEK